MKIQELDIFHGAALAQIVKHNSFKALNRASTGYGHYKVNSDRHIFIKYSKSNNTPWRFVFQLHDLNSIQSATSSGDHVFLCLVCGKVTICALTQDEFSEIIDFNKYHTQSLSVHIPDGGSCHVSGALGNLKHTIRHNSFPDKIFP